MARKQREEDSGGTWLDTYADMVTLLLTFFVVMLSMSAVEVEKFDALIQSFRPGEEKGEQLPGNATHNASFLEDGELTMDNLYLHIRKYVDDNDMESAMSISKQDDVVYIRFSSQILFEPDRYYLLDASKPLMDFVGEVLKIYEEKIKTINVCGHTAQTERVQTEISDWRLSGERAATVAMFFEDNWDIDKRKMITFGYGDNYPIADNKNEVGRRQNRRVELVIVGVESLMEFDVYGILGGVFDNSQFPTSGGADDILTPSQP